MKRVIIRVNVYISLGIEKKLQKRKKKSKAPYRKTLQLNKHNESIFGFTTSNYDWTLQNDKKRMFVYVLMFVKQSAHPAIEIYRDCGICLFFAFVLLQWRYVI